MFFKAAKHCQFGHFSQPYERKQSLESDCEFQAYSTQARHAFPHTWKIICNGYYSKCNNFKNSLSIKLEKLWTLGLYHPSILELNGLEEDLKVELISCSSYDDYSPLIYIEDPTFDHSQTSLKQRLI